MDWYPPVTECFNINKAAYICKVSNFCKALADMWTHKPHFRKKVRRKKKKKHTHTHTHTINLSVSPPRQIQISILKLYGFTLWYIHSVRKQQAPRYTMRKNKGWLDGIWFSRQSLGCHHRSNPGNPLQHSRRFSNGKIPEEKRVSLWWWQE